MTKNLLNTTSRTSKMIGRRGELEIIRNAIQQPPTSCCVVLIVGHGGLGKSRMAEEILRNHELAGDSFIGDIIDLTDVRLHTRSQLMKAIRDSLMNRIATKGKKIVQAVHFKNYDIMLKRLSRMEDLQGDFNYIEEQRKKTEEEFYKDYKYNAKKQHLILIMDTAEKLIPVGPKWLIKDGLIREKDLAFSAKNWLAEQIQESRFPNTTIILVGRGEEGRDVFENIRQAAKTAKEPCKVEEIELEPFKIDDTAAYLYENIRDAENHDEIKLADQLRNIVENRERLEVLQLYTDGQPIRLSLYIDLMISAIRIPEYLEESLNTAQERMKKVGREEMQMQIEREFIYSLFARPSLRTEVLKTLARAPRGLSIEQLHFAIGSPKTESPEQFTERNEQSLRKEIADEIEKLKKLTITKPRPDGRLGLQDEIYTIYANAMARREIDIEDETKARKSLYKKLLDWEEFEIVKEKEKLLKLQEGDLAKIPLERPSQAISAQFLLSDSDIDQRIRYRSTIQDIELEILHYSLLIDPQKNVNNLVSELAEKKWIANDEEADAREQEVEWQIWNSDDLKKFLGLTRENIDILMRVEDQIAVNRWIKRFVIRKEYQRAIEFVERVNEVISIFPEKEDRRKRSSWEHPFAAYERQVWYTYAKILDGRVSADLLSALKKYLVELVCLYETPIDQVALPAISIRGFRGHPAEERLLRVIAIGYNTLGYGYTRIGLSRSAIEYYGKSLFFTRESKMKALEATIRNNLSAALSERGYARARRICTDGLMLRQVIGAENPIGLSYNTLALIDNDNLRPDLAWREAATALAYFKLSDDPRGKGLSYLQLAEALRRLARLKSKQSVNFYISDPKEIIYNHAQSAIEEAIDIFTNSPARTERSRLIEAYIERGCLWRDLITETRDPENRIQHMQESIADLEWAVQEAANLHNSYLELDATVNIAWTYYYAGYLQDAEDSLARAEKILPEDSLIREGHPHPRGDRDDVYLYREMSKMYSLRGRIEIDRFKDRRFKIEAEMTEESRSDRHAKIATSQTAQKHLAKAAEHYVLGLAYSQLFSPRSTALTMIYNRLYESLKVFNPTELNSFSVHARVARDRYHIRDLRNVLTDLGDLDEFLHSCFGVEIQES